MIFSLEERRIYYPYIIILTITVQKKKKTDATSFFLCDVFSDVVFIWKKNPVLFSLFIRTCFAYGIRFSSCQYFAHLLFLYVWI